MGEQEMRVDVTGCSNCPFAKKRQAEPVAFKCKVLDKDVAEGQPVHDMCPLIDGAVPVRLAGNDVGIGNVEAYLGYSVRTDDGQLGVVARKFRAWDSQFVMMGDATVPSPSSMGYLESDRNSPWYHVLSDGWNAMRVYPQRRVVAVTSMQPRPNDNELFRFFFGGE